MRAIKRTILFLAVLFALPAFGQGVWVPLNVTQQATVAGAPNVVTVPPSAQVKFCNFPANAVPCTNLATTYSSANLSTPCSTSTQFDTSTSTCVSALDAQQNGGVWVPAGNYAYTVTIPGGANLGPYYVTAGGSSGGGGGSPAFPAFSSQFSNALGTGFSSASCGGSPIGVDSVSSPTVFNVPCKETVTGALQANGNNNAGNVATKSAAAAGIQYVTPQGSDTNDGLFWGSAKLTVFTALESLPGGSFSPPTCGRGTVYFTDGSSANTTSGAGLWLMGANDPNYTSPPAGWMRCGFGVSIIGIPSHNYGPVMHKPTALLGGGSGADVNHPGIWLSAIQTPTLLQNIAIEFPGRAIVVGECSNHGRTDTCNSSDITFENVTGSINEVAGNGPCTDITGASFWVWLRDWSCTGSDGVNAPTSDKAAALLVDGRTNSGLGLIFVTDGGASNGGIKTYAGNNINQIYVNNFATEGQVGEPAVWFAAAGQSGESGTMANIENVQVADDTNNSPSFQNDIGGVAGQVFVSNMQFGPVIGAATILNQYNAGQLNAQVISPLRSGQVGFFSTHIVGSSENTERIGAPTSVRFSNLATTTASSWTNSGSTTFTSGITDPYGGTNAGQFVSTSGGQSGFLRPVNNQALAIGDYLIGAAFVRSQSANGYSGNTPIQIQTGGAPASCSNSFEPILGDGEWAWVYSICRITGSPATYAIGLYSIYDTTHTLQVFAPVFNYIPVNTISQNEIYAYVNSLNPYPNGSTVGQAASYLGLAAPSYTSTGTNGGLSGSEGTGSALNSGAGPCVAAVDSLWPDSTTHHWKSCNNNGIQGQVMDLSDQATITYNASGTTVFAAGGTIASGGVITATHSTATTFSPVGLVKWGSYTVEIFQDGTGGGTTFTLGTAGSCSAWKVASGSGYIGTTVTLASAASAMNVLAFTFDGTRCVATFQ